LLISDRRVTEAFSAPYIASGRSWLAGDWPSTGGVLNITAAAWTVGFQWWRSGDITRMQNVSEYMLVLALCLVCFLYMCTKNVHFSSVCFCQYFVTIFLYMLAQNNQTLATVWRRSTAMTQLYRDRHLLWPPCVADADIIFSSCGFFYLSSSFFPRLISAVAEWMSTILLHMVWP